MKKAVQEKMDSMQQEYREDLDLNMKLVGRALQDLQDEADKKKQKRVRCLFGACSMPVRLSVELSVLLSVCFIVQGPELSF